MLLTLLADAKVQIDGIFYELDSEAKTASVCRFSSGNDYSGDVVIPESFSYENETYLVTSIGDGAFLNCGALNSITIPKTIIYVGNCAFERAKSLKAVYISDLEAWCKIKFGGWQYANPLYLAHRLYLNGEEIQELEIPNSITEIKDFAFQGMSSMTSVIIPNSVKSIGKEAFFRCGLSSVTIPESVTKISSQAFYQCSLLSSVSFPESVFSVGEMVFTETPWLTEQPDGIVYVGKILYCYKGEMPDNTTIEIKEGTKGIAGDAFWGCSGLTSVTIPNSVVSIGFCAFCSCTGLKSLTIPETVKEFDGAFVDCSGLTSITFPQNITSIGKGTFEGCSGLTSFVIPENVTSIGESAFQGCSGLTSITIPDKVTYIGDGAFSNCTSLTSMTLPNNITYLGYFIFMGCRSLTSVNLPNSVTEIRGQLFQDCPLKTITIPQNVTTIEEYGLWCSDLVEIKILAQTPPTIYEYSFFNYESTVDVQIKVPKGCVEIYKTAPIWSKFENIVELDDKETGIAAIRQSINHKNIYYNLKGQRIEKPSKGIYILNGKKTIIK